MLIWFDSVSDRIQKKKAPTVSYWCLFGVPAPLMLIREQSLILLHRRER